MNLLCLDNVLVNPKEYVQDILDHGFQDYADGWKVFKGIQPRDKDEFENFVLYMLPNYEVKWNFVRQSPINQLEPNFIHTDEMMGDITVILYLSQNHPDNDGTTMYDKEGKPMCVTYAKFNRMVAFDSDCPHSRNIFENFGEGDEARLVQVIFLEQKI